jgi:hypothetical protein
MALSTAAKEGMEIKTAKTKNIERFFKKYPPRKNQYINPRIERQLAHPPVMETMLKCCRDGNFKDQEFFHNSPH